MKVLTITHGDDLDGLTCAALIMRIRGGEVRLANYDNIEGVLREVQPPLEQLYICDLNIRRGLLGDILRIKGFSEVIIIDHHGMDEGVKRSLVEAGVELIHDTRDSAGVLVYDLFRDELGKEPSRLAAYAAISDMFEDGPMASRILSRLDRKFTQHEALLLTHALAGDLSFEFKSRVLEGLRDLRYPHEIKGAVKASVSHLREIVRIKESIPGRARILGRIACMECVGEPSTGAAANLLMETMGVDVGVCYKIHGDDVNISLRGEKMLDEHLGVLAKRLANRFGGFGGGHKRASGAKIPVEHLNEFLSELSEDLR